MKLDEEGILTEYQKEPEGFESITFHFFQSFDWTFYVDMIVSLYRKALWQGGSLPSCHCNSAGVTIGSLDLHQMGGDADDGLWDYDDFSGDIGIADFFRDSVDSVACLHR